MKLWFLEPKPNVFVSGVKDSVAETVLEYLYDYCPMDSGVVIFRSLRSAPGYEMRSIGSTTKKWTMVTGMELVVEK